MSGFEIVRAIRKINPNAKVVVRGSDIDTCEIEWIVGAEISKSDIETKIAELKTAYDAKDYQRKRATEYPSVFDQLDKIYHSGIDEWKKVIKITKDKYPK